MDTNYHIPVMLQECIEGLNINPDGIYVDVTFGGGGHSKAILQQLSDKGRLIAFDQDADAVKNLPDDKRITLYQTNFKYFANFLQLEGVKADGILADLGVSSHHFDDEGRGFSFRFADAPLDMRMNQNATFTAADLLNTYSPEQLKSVFLEYGEIKNAWKLAQNIVSYRAKKTLATTAQLIEAAGNCVPAHSENKYLATLFQAIRIEVNGEIDALEEFLLSTADAMADNGRLVIMTYHSLEDRPVKNYIKAGNIQGKEEKDVYGNIIAPFTAVNRKVITPTEQELSLNPRSRSAKLRIAQKNVLTTQQTTRL
ncbi:MAG: 16S rRNA (cytosine(1402)-N(4))-methyltransferase RsmH [Bacteroidales bacterium]|nr:16S rRNA (cytosine(1402)-N(4))-methyltransferase RsmH [Bacteroidales bacterium]